MPLRRIIKNELCYFIWLINILTLVRWLSRWFFVLSLWMVPLSINIGESKIINRWTMYAAHDVFSFGISLYCAPQIAYSVFWNFFFVLVRVCVSHSLTTIVLRFIRRVVFVHTYTMSVFFFSFLYIFFKCKNRFHWKSLYLFLNHSSFDSVCQLYLSVENCQLQYIAQLAFSANLARNNNYSYWIEVSRRHTHSRHFMIRAFVLNSLLFFGCFAHRKLSNISLFTLWHVLSHCSMALTIDSASEC